MDWKAIVGQNVRRIRLTLGLTQEQLAVDAGIDLTYLGGIERGKRNPSLMVLVGLATALHVQPVDLLTFKK